MMYRAELNINPLRYIISNIEQEVGVKPFNKIIGQTFYIGEAINYLVPTAIQSGINKQYILS